MAAILEDDDITAYYDVVNHDVTQQGETSELRHKNVLRGAAKGISVFQFNMGEVFYFNKNDKYFPKAEKWFRRAAEQGYPEAQRMLAFMLERGEGIKQDKKEARVWYSKAAEQGDSVAQTRLAAMIAKGLGEPIVLLHDSKKKQEIKQSAERKQQQEVSQYSVLDSTKTVDKTHFVASIMRKPTGGNPEHAFLMVEGRSDSGKAILIRYDLVIGAKRAGQATMAAILVRQEEVAVENVARTFLVDFLREEEVYSISWGITKEQARTIHHDVLKNQKNPPKYQLLGDTSIVAQSRSEEGHNCFTWAREKLLNLKDDKIKLPITWRDYIVAQTSYHIKDPRERRSYSS